jgi:DNA replication ATP-dependent helicase Dna2
VIRDVLQRTVSSEYFGDQPQIHVNTTDSFQGSQAQIIIYSFVRSNSEHEIGNLLKDFRRLHVAITRAQHQLIFFGDTETLRHGGDRNLARLVEMALGNV